MKHPATLNNEVDHIIELLVKYLSILTISFITLIIIGSVL